MPKKGLSDLFKERFRAAGNLVAESLPSPVPEQGATPSLGPSAEGLEQTAMNLGYNMVRPEKPIQNAGAGDVGEALGEKAGMPLFGRAVGTAASLAANLMGGKSPQAMGAKANEFGKIIKVGQEAAKDSGKIIKVGQQAEKAAGEVKNIEPRSLDSVMNETRVLYDRLLGEGRDKQTTWDALFRNSKEAIDKLKKSGVQGRDIQRLQENMKHISKTRSLLKP